VGARGIIGGGDRCLVVVHRVRRIFLGSIGARAECSSVSVQPAAHEDHA
jgi:hypothetical protein